MNDETSWHEQGRRHLAAGRPAEAHACLERAAARHPDDLAVRADLARALYLGARADEAVALYRDLVARQPDDLGLGIDLGRALRATGAYGAALDVYRALLKRAPREAVLLNNIGNCLLAQGDARAAIDSLRQAIAAKPDFADAHHNLSLALLSDGQMREGWEEARWRLHRPVHWIDGKPVEEWDGTPMPGKVLLVRPEQGLGDTIQFSRYVPLIAPRARVVLGVPRPLHRLMRGQPGVEQVITEGDAAPAYDAVCMLMSLPRLLGAHEAKDGGPVPYLRADPAAVACWRARLDSLPAPRIGLVWSGSPALGAITLGDRSRSVPLAALAPLRGPTFISLQKGPAAVQARHPPEGMALIDWTEELSDFADTAALIEALDLVIGVDTSVAHLAGALGRPVWMLNRADTDWRWGLTGETTAWYPTMRIFRQAARFDWTAPIAAMAAALRAPPSIPAVLAQSEADLGAGRPAEAEARLRRTIGERPRDPDIAALHNALAHHLFGSGRWAEAWPEWLRGHPTVGWGAPLWDGSEMAGGTLLLHADAAEDVLMFGRYVAEAVRRSRARVVLSVPPNLRRLMTGWAGAAVATGDRPSHTAHCPFSHLPALFRARPDTVPDTGLCPLPPIRAMEYWAPRLSGLRGLRVGVALDDPALSRAAAVLDGVNLVALRERADTRDLVHDWSRDFQDLTAVAGLIAQLDLVVADDNPTAHLAAALGRPVWLIGAATPRWPWTAGREDNPWYPTLRQFPFGAAAAIVAELTALAARAPEEQMFERANDCYRRDDLGAAATGFRQALALNPDHPGALGNLTVTMLMLGRPEIALRHAQAGVRAAPGSHPLRLRLGLALHANGRFAEAVTRLREARAMDPGHGDTIAALGNALGAMGDPPAAIETLRQAVASRPGHAGYHANLAYALLRAGHWREGWREHEHRPERPRGERMWGGDTLREAPLVLRHEQGVGDVIQFCRFAPLLVDRARGGVFLTAPPSLKALLGSLHGVTILSEGDPTPPGAWQFPLLSVPYLLGTTLETLPAEVPYLRADATRAARWRARIGAMPGLRVGLAWAGNPRLGRASLASTDRRRSLPERTLAPLRAVPDTTFISLQVGDAPAPGVPVTDWTSELTDFAETAALMSTLDLIIAVDTAVAHLAGALGKPVWLLNRFDTDWRWMDGGEGSVWYPALRQFRQASPGDWPGVIARVSEALRCLAARP